jgi:hypothetical protein
MNYDSLVILKFVFRLFLDLFEIQSILGYSLCLENYSLILLLKSNQKDI